MSEPTPLVMTQENINHVSKLVNDYIRIHKKEYDRKEDTIYVDVLGKIQEKLTDFLEVLVKEKKITQEQARKITDKMNFLQDTLLASKVNNTPYPEEEYKSLKSDIDGLITQAKLGLIKEREENAASLKAVTDPRTEVRKLTTRFNYIAIFNYDKTKLEKIGKAINDQLDKMLADKEIDKKTYDEIIANINKVTGIEAESKAWKWAEPFQKTKLYDYIQKLETVANPISRKLTDVLSEPTLRDDFRKFLFDQHGEAASKTLDNFLNKEIADPNLREEFKNFVATRDQTKYVSNVIEKERKGTNKHFEAMVSEYAFNLSLKQVRELKGPNPFSKFFGAIAGAIGGAFVGLYENGLKGFINGGRDGGKIGWRTGITWVGSVMTAISRGERGVEVSAGDYPNYVDINNINLMRDPIAPVASTDEAKARGSLSSSIPAELLVQRVEGLRASISENMQREGELRARKDSLSSLGSLSADEEAAAPEPIIHAAKEAMESTPPLSTPDSVTADSKRKPSRPRMGSSDNSENQ